MLPLAWSQAELLPAPSHKYPRHPTIAPKYPSLPFMYYPCYLKCLLAQLCPPLSHVSPRSAPSHCAPNPASPHHPPHTLLSPTIPPHCPYEFTAPWTETCPACPSAPDPSASPSHPTEPSPACLSIQTSLQPLTNPAPPHPQSLLLQPTSHPVLSPQTPPPSSAPTLICCSHLPTRIIPHSLLTSQAPLPSKAVWCLPHATPHGAWEPLPLNTPLKQHPPPLMAPCSRCG